jgi:alanine or glycine:cation symporter, AGCS family
VLETIPIPGHRPARHRRLPHPAAGLHPGPRLGHGFAVTTGRYDDPNEPGDVSHFQALTTALSATVGIGNIAGVAIAIHWGGPGALFWMWVTALLGMAVKYTEVTLAQHYRTVEFADRDPTAGRARSRAGRCTTSSAASGPGASGSRWRCSSPAAGLTSFLTGNAVQANTVADTMLDEFGIPVWATGLVTAAIVGPGDPGRHPPDRPVTGVLAPLMAAIYVAGALVIISMNYGQILPTFGLIFREAFNPTAGVAGTGVGALLVTMMWGVRRGLFSNEAGQGSAPIAHAAAKTDEPVSEGVVALLEPFIDTIVICTMTGLVILITGVWTTVPTPIEPRRRRPRLADGRRRHAAGAGDGAGRDRGRDGRPVDRPDGRSGRLARGRGRPALRRPGADAALHRHHPPAGALAVADRRRRPTASSTADAVESGAPLTKLAFSAACPGEWGGSSWPAAVLPVRDLDRHLLELLRRPLRQLPVRAEGGAAVQDRLRRHALRGRGGHAVDHLDDRRHRPGLRHLPEPDRSSRGWWCG